MACSSCWPGSHRARSGSSTRDLTEPSPLALEVLSARPYAYLDDAPLEERRTQAVISRRWLAPETAADLGRLDPEAIARVREEAWPDPANADELHDALVWLGFLGADEVQPGWDDWLTHLAQERRVTRLQLGAATLWIAVERLPQFQALWPTAAVRPRDQRPGPVCRAKLVARRGADGTSARPAGRFGPRRRGHTCGSARARSRPNSAVASGA